MPRQGVKSGSGWRAVRSRPAALKRRKGGPEEAPLPQTTKDRCAWWLLVCASKPTRSVGHELVAVNECQVVTLTHSNPSVEPQLPRPSRPEMVSVVGLLLSVEPFRFPVLFTEPSQA